MQVCVFALIAILVLSGCGSGFQSTQSLTKVLSSEPVTPVPDPTPTPPVTPVVKGGRAVDLSQPVNQTFLNNVKALGVSTIIRYYDHPNETIRGKTLRRSERDLIVRNGFKIAVVFQHNNNVLTSFTQARGKMDAERSLVLATENLQPQDSAIYFGVDGGWSTDADLNRIQLYVSTASAIVRQAGFRMGVYGSGRVCMKVLSENLADHCWLANARGWPDYNVFFESDQWMLRQFLPEKVGSFDVDFNDIHPEVSDFGQFP
jgi:Domain of unknown function (DUF1906)